MSRFNRRSVLKGAAGTLSLVGLGATTVTGHESTNTHKIHEHEVTKNAELVGYHSLGDFGPESEGGRPEYHADAIVSEVWVENGHVFAAFYSSAEKQGIAILDANGYLEADTRDEVRDAEMSLIATIGNETESGTAADVKTTDDGQYLAYTKQAIGPLTGAVAGDSVEQNDAPGAEPAGMAIYDISDPRDPEYLGTAQGPNVGFHNCFMKRIDGTPYAFGVQGVVGGDNGVHIYQIDETTGAVIPVNFWSGGDLPVTGVGTEGCCGDGPYPWHYSHDFYVEEDPKTGKPLGYLPYWNNGVRVLDLSDPMNITELGVGKMDAAHYAQPAPALIDGKRVFIGSQEVFERSNGPSGFVKLFDGDALFEDGVTECPVLDEWTLYENVSYTSYAFSPHNSDITEDGWISQAHYHGGIRFLKIQPPSESPTGEWRLAGKRHEKVGEEERAVRTPGKAYYRDHVEVPRDSQTGSRMAPNFWSARVENGITFGGDMGTGLYAIAADPIEIGEAAGEADERAGDVPGGVARLLR